MTHRYIRIAFLVALVASAWISVRATAGARSLPFSPRVLASGSTTYAAVDLVHARLRPRAFQRFVLSQPLRDSIVALALSQLGIPYVMGGTTPGRGFDCSGLVRWVTAQVHMPVPRTARMQARMGEPVDRERLEPGDLVAFGEGMRVSHVGIYVGDGKFVHASSAAGRVVVSTLDRRPSRLIRPMRGARRLLATRDQLGT